MYQEEKKAVEGGTSTKKGDASGLRGRSRGCDECCAYQASEWALPDLDHVRDEGEIKEGRKRALVSVDAGMYGQTDEAWEYDYGNELVEDTCSKRIVLNGQLEMSHMDNRRCPVRSASSRDRKQCPFPSSHDTESCPFSSSLSMLFHRTLGYGGNSS